MNFDLLLKKLSQIETYLNELETFIFSRNPEDVKKDITLLHTAERLVQVLVDTMIDINIHILLSKEKTYDKSQSTFLILGEMGILPEEFAKKIAPIVGLRKHFSSPLRGIRQRPLYQKLIQEQRRFQTIPCSYLRFY